MRLQNSKDDWDLSHVEKQNPVVILGAGPAGLACAYRILKNSAQKSVVVLDRLPFVGGAGASFKWKEHTLDYGPHAFHCRGSEPEQLIRTLFADEPDLLIEGTKQVHVYLKKRRFKYPLQVSECLVKFNPLLSLLIMVEFSLTSLFHTVVSIPVENFENWGRKRFGSSLYKMSFGDYTEKVWKTKATKISEKFASEKIQGFSFVNLIRKLLRVGGQVTEPYFQTWIYHKYGSGNIYLRMADQIRRMGGDVLLGTNVRSINHDCHRVFSLTIDRDGSTAELPCSHIVNTIPLPHFVNLFGDTAPFPVRYHASKLRYISLILVYIEFAIERAGDDHWFYLLDRHFKFNRVTEQKNLSAATMGPGKTVLSCELTCRIGDEYWKMSDEQLFELAKADCKNVHFLKDKMNSITDYLIKRVPNVYEIYFKNFDQHAERLLGYLSEFENVSTAGRRGLFLQGDQHQSVEMGLRMADIVSNGSGAPQQIESFLRHYVRYIDDY